MSSRFRRKYRGFTLIELLVVIAIIGLLATLAVVAFGTARARARDAKRIADITEIDKVIRLYYDEHGVYPGQGTTAGQKISPNCLMFSIVTDLQSSGYMPKVPMDPADDGTCTFGNDANYYYAWDTTHTGPVFQH
jgi:prepilin-type N-terminal cleavage/methylation domain-containing protein